MDPDQSGFWIRRTLVWIRIPSDIDIVKNLSSDSQSQVFRLHLDLRGRI